MNEEDAVRRLFRDANADAPNFRAGALDIVVAGRRLSRRRRAGRLMTVLPIAAGLSTAAFLAGRSVVDGGNHHGAKSLQELTSSPSPSPSGAQCGLGVEPQYLLGGASNGQTYGSPEPIQIMVTTGEHFVVMSHFAQRELTVPATSSPEIRLVCSRRYQTGPDQDSSVAEFVAVGPGAGTIRSETTDCVGCVDLIWSASVTIRESAVAKASS